MTRRLAALWFATMLAGVGEAPAQAIRLATYNIHHGEGTDGVLDLERVARDIKGAQIAALQEVDVRFRERSRLEDQAARMGELLGGKVVFAGNLVEGEGRYGVALVTQFPVVSQRNHPLPRAAGREKAEPRGLLEVVLEVEGRRVRVFVTHLAHDSDEDRGLQVEAIRKIVGLGQGPALLLGDLNFRPDSELYTRLLAPMTTGGPPLFEDAWIRAGDGAEGETIGLESPKPGRIDYILGTPDLARGFQRARVVKHTRASDHQPVLVELRITPGS